MARLERLLGRAQTVRITPEGIDDSHFDYDFFRNMGEKIFDGTAQLGIILVDTNTKQTDVYGQFRRFKKRPYQMDPVHVPAYLRCEGTVDNDHIRFTKEFLKRLVQLEPPNFTFRQKVGEGEKPWGKYVTFVDRTMEHKKWWAGMFIDVYSRSSGLNNQLNYLSAQSKKIMHQRERYKRFVFADLLIDLLEDDGRSADAATPEDMRHCLHRHGYFKNPFMFRKEDDYLYFLLGFQKRGVGLERAHEYMVQSMQLQNEISSQLTALNHTIAKVQEKYPDAALYQRVDVWQHGMLFGPEMGLDILTKGKQRIMDYGNRRHSPAIIDTEQWELGYYVRSRNATLPRNMKSYTLTKIRRNPRHIQREIEYTIAAQRGIVRGK